MVFFSSRIRYTINPVSTRTARVIRPNNKLFIKTPLCNKPHGTGYKNK
jgi:hypothetical protein